MPQDQQFHSGPVRTPFLPSASQHGCKTQVHQNQACIRKQGILGAVPGCHQSETEKTIYNLQSLLTGKFVIHFHRSLLLSRAVDPYLRTRVMTVQELLAAYQWKPVRNCPGRYVLEKPQPAISPGQLAQVSCAPAEFHVQAAKDMVLVMPLDGGGLITYRRADGTYFHTLNIEFGFERKLAQLGIVLT
jgi:hypothetical protein